MKTSFKPLRILAPAPTTLVVTGTMEKANIVTIAWVSILTSAPPTLGISVGQKGFSGNAIKENKNFTVNIASAEIMAEADFCGITSGKDTDKFKDTGLTKIPSRIIESPIIKECPINIECKLVGHNMVGNTNHFIGEIVQTHIDTDKLKDPKHAGSLILEKINPLIYMGGAKEYRKIGEKIGDAYQIGEQLFE